MSNTRLLLPRSQDPESLDSCPAPRTLGIPTWGLSYRRVLLRCCGLYRPIVRFVRALRLCLRSGIWNMKTLLSKDQWGLDLGPHYQRLPCGCLALNSRTDARSVGIRALTLRYPAANTAQFRLFLEGFDTGEQFASRNSGTLAQVSSSASHSERCLSRPQDTNSLDMLKRHWYKSQYESARHQNPSPSD